MEKFSWDSKKTFILLFVFFTFAVSLIVYYRSSSIKSEMNSNISNGKIVSSPAVIASYQEKIVLALSDYLKETNSPDFSFAELSQEEMISLSSKIDKINEAILPLTVPSEFRDFHLNLVIYLNKLKDSLALADQEEINSVVDKINALIADRPWLRIK